MTCNHHRMYFERGNLFCVECGADRTPSSNVRTVVVFDDYREKILQDLGRIVNDLPEEILADIEEYVDYLKWKSRK